jgi:anti-sigma regulatory factor (Ser/Thr protein kinase)
MLEGADRALQADDDERIVTAFVAVYDPVTAELTYASAGHPAPLLCRGDSVEPLPGEAGLPLGVISREKRAVRTMHVDAQSLLLLYTDGLTEATRDPLAGELRLRDALRDPELRSSRNLARQLRETLLPDGSRDDVAILAVQITPDESRSALQRWTVDADDVRAAKEVQYAFVGELQRQGVPPDDLFAAELVFAELLGNAVRYAPSAVEVILDWMGPNPVLHVLDQGPGFHATPRLPPDALSERGRGVFIVASLARDFHVMPRANGGSHARAVLTTHVRRGNGKPEGRAAGAGAA